MENTQFLNQTTDMTVAETINHIRHKLSNLPETARHFGLSKEVEASNREHLLGVIAYYEELPQDKTFGEVAEQLMNG